MSAFGYREEINYEVIFITPDGIKNVRRLNGGVINTELCNVEHKL